MSHIENPTTILAKIHKVFKESDETGSCRAVLRGTMRGESTDVPDTFHASVDSRDLSPTAPKTIAEQFDFPIPEEGDELANSIHDPSKMRSKPTTKPTTSSSKGHINPTAKGLSDEASSSSTSAWLLGARPIALLRKPATAPAHEPMDTTEKGKPSPFTAALQHRIVASNRYASEYARFSGEGQNPRRVKAFKMWFSFLGDVLPIDVKVSSACTVAQLIGYSLYRFNCDTHRKTTIDEDESLFELRLNETDGEPDMELPALTEDHHIYNLGFDALCICRKQNVPKAVVKKQKRGYYYVYYPDGSSTLFQRDTSNTIGDILKQALRKRGVKLGEYEVEVKGEAGISLDAKETLADVEGRHGGRVELAIIKKFARRYDYEGDEEGQSGLVRAMDYILSLNHTQAFYVTKLKGRYSSQSVELRISCTKVAVTSFSSRNSILHKSKKLDIAIEHIVVCKQHEQHENVFDLVYWLNGDWKEVVFEAKTESDAEKIVSSINGIQRFRGNRLNRELALKFHALKDGSRDES